MNETGNGVIDWAALRAAALAAAAHSYSPYSRLAVGAAALCDDGRVVTGCNVENASYGLGVCAEVTMAGQLMLSGGGRFSAVSCRSAADLALTPCGRCRQVLHELGGPGCLVDTDQGIRSMAELLPHAFGPEDLP